MDEDFEDGLAQAARSMGLTIYGIDRKHGLFRVAVDRPGGVNLEHLEIASRVFSDLLDSQDSVPGGRYVLEVSSPGAERDIRNTQQAACAVGLYVSVEFRKASCGQREVPGNGSDDEGKKIFGRLIAVDDERLLVQLTERDTSLDVDEDGCAWVALGDNVSVHTVLEWDGDSGAPGRRVRGRDVKGRAPGAPNSTSRTGGSRIGRSKARRQGRAEKVKG
ncbi:MAG: hypothetical protein M1399_04430 [Actinobacteria bacterium]|nr:hypothetical protein [Actinomycetota bacterium]MCL5447476.1 hypothetical protein [Actinomycetota bacterium]